MKVFVDLNVLLDVILDRSEFVKESAQSLGRIVSVRSGRGYVAQHAVTTLFYIVRKQCGIENARTAVRKVLKLLSVISATQKILIDAADAKYADYEDAVSFLSASAAGCDVIITRNPTDYSKSPVRAMTPAEFLALGVD